MNLKELKRKLEKNKGKGVELKISFKGEEWTIAGTLKEIGSQSVSIESAKDRISIIPLAPNLEDTIEDIIKEIKVNGEVIFSQE